MSIDLSAACIAVIKARRKLVGKKVERCVSAGGPQGLVSGVRVQLHSL